MHEGLFMERWDEEYVQPKTVPRTVSKVLWMDMLRILS